MPLGLAGAQAARCWLLVPGGARGPTVLPIRHRC
jgi:hypothetical protein